MSKLALVSFDLHCAPSSSYLAVQTDLARLGLHKQIRSRKSGKLSSLPANTFVARVSGKWANKSTADLRSYLKKAIRKALRALGLRAEIFVVVAEDWAWSRRTV